MGKCWTCRTMWRHVLRVVNNILAVVWANPPLAWVEDSQTLLKK